MKYNINTIKKKFDDKEKINFVFFWKPTQTDGVFSQWYMCDFSENGVVYNCAEQYMMAQKALLMKDYDIYKLIMKSSNPKEMKSLGRKVKNFNEKLWDDNKYNIVLKASILKFGQNCFLLKSLIDTSDKVLVEASPFDTIWGIGLAKEDNRDVLNPYNWLGENLLGFALMEARDILSKK